VCLEANGPVRGTSRLVRVHSRPLVGSPPTFDEELLLWLGDETAAGRAADADLIREIAGEFAMGFDRLADVGPAVTVFGSSPAPEASARSMSCSSC
jgi:hypothetical protein